LSGKRQKDFSHGDPRSLYKRGRVVRILVVKDQKKVAKTLEQRLEAEHYEVAVANTRKDGF